MVAPEFMAHNKPLLALQNQLKNMRPSWAGAVADPFQNDQTSWNLFARCQASGNVQGPMSRVQSRFKGGKRGGVGKLVDVRGVHNAAAGDGHQAAARQGAGVVAGGVLGRRGSDRPTGGAKGNYEL